MTIKVWVQGAGLYPAEAGRNIKESLSRQGIEVHDTDPRRASCAGVLLCGAVNGEVCDQVRDLTCNGQGRVLAGFCGKLTADSAWRLIQAGASDVLSCRQSGDFARDVAARLLRWESVERLLDDYSALHGLVGVSRTWLSMVRQLVEVAHFTTASILILGESGTGKELLAHLVHGLDARPGKKDLTILDCSTLMPELAGSEFFGHERGAFTGAVSARDGAFALADRGTLFLDEVGELPPRLQTHLLRVIQEQSFKRVGGNAWQKASFRLVCATNRDLPNLVREGGFRADLFYRLAGFVCKLPPLRERPEDILPLTFQFLKEHFPSREPPELDAPVLDCLLKRDYPGNVRDLKQFISRMLCRYAGHGPVTVGCIPPDERPAWPADQECGWCDAAFESAIRRALAQGVGLKAISRAAEETAIRIAVDDAGNLQQAALRLGVTDRTLQLRRASRQRAG